MKLRYNQFMIKRILVGALITVAIVGVLLRGRIRDTFIELQKPPVPSEQPRGTSTVTPRPTTSIRQTPVATPSPTPSALTGAVNLAVPFSSQAPRGDWSLPWQEACEETSALLVDAFWKSANPDVGAVEAGILALVDWENKTYGYYQHTTAAQTARMIREVYGYKRVDVKYDIGIDDIARELHAGRPVIVPLAGRLLGNPYYTYPGPVYHMMVVKGIAENGDIITNDVGTRHGKNLTYNAAVFLNAMHDAPGGGSDWPPGVDPVQYIQSGRRAMIVVWPNP